MGLASRLYPELHSSGFNLLSALGCGRLGIPSLDIGGGWWGEVVLSSTQGRRICFEERVRLCVFCITVRRRRNYW